MIFKFLIPNGIALGFHFFIVILFGLGVSGEHAQVMALSSIWAVLICLRGDIHLLLAPDYQRINAFLYSVTFTVVISFVLTLAALLINSTHPALSPTVIACASLAAFNELIAASYLKENKMWGFVAIKSLPYPVFLAALMFNNTFAIAELWMGSLLLTLLISGGSPLFRLAKSSKQKAFFISELIHHVVDLLPPASATFVVILMSNISVLLITEVYGTAEAGIWINCYRILFLPMFYVSSGLQVRMAKDLSETNSKSVALSFIVKTWKSIEGTTIVYVLFLILIAILISQVIPSGLRKQYLLPMIAALSYGFFRMYISFLAVATQATQRNRSLITILCFELLFNFGFILIGSPTADQFYIFLTVYPLMFYFIIRIFKLPVS